MLTEFIWQGLGSGLCRGGICHANRVHMARIRVRVMVRVSVRVRVGVRVRVRVRARVAGSRMPGRIRAGGVCLCGLGLHLG